MFLGKLKEKGKNIIKRNPSFVNYFPFNNKLKLSGAEFLAEGILTHCVVKCSGKQNRIRICEGGGCIIVKSPLLEIITPF